MGFSSRKNAFSLYLTCNLDEFEKELENLGTYKRGVGCMYIKTLDDIDIKVFKKLLQSSFKSSTSVKKK
jgi:hypothetical protein